MKAILNDIVLAESEQTLVVEGNHYFPPSSLNKEYFEASSHQTTCFWKGTASYYHVKVDGEKVENTAWYYPNPSEKANHIKDHVAFWKAVKVVE
ncbi:MAG TPA: DUF427 domain-containing protein [Saprospiraceae bacterium]|nr:DUF427 domain-containing protein [Saprospiraceae bacterium]